MSQPLVSIITPTYNHSKYIIDCIKSVQTQTYSNWEMLIINDGSTDNSAEVIEEYINRIGDQRVILFNQENVGIHRLSETYNVALDKSKGELIALLDGDDMWEADKLERQTKIMHEYPEIVMSWGRVIHVSDDLSVTYKTTPCIETSLLPFYNNSPIGKLAEKLVYESPVGALTMLIRKSALTDIGGFQQGYNLPLIDLPTIMALSLKGTFHFDPVPYGTWRVFRDQTTRRYPAEITLGRFALTMDYIKKIRQLNFDYININETEVKNYFNRLILPSYARSGRYALMRKDFAKARKDYKHVIFYKGPFELSWRIRAMIGYMFSFLHLDVEGIAKVFGKESYK